MDAEEYEARCPNWARNGECRKNPKFMRVYCAKSCKECVGMFLSLLILLGSSSTRQGLRKSSDSFVWQGTVS